MDRLDPRAIGARIAALRKARHWTQKELADRLQVTDKAVSKWETGVNCPDLSLWQPLAALFGVPLLALLGLESEPAEAAAAALTEASRQQKETVKRELKARAWLNLALGGLLFAALIGASWLFAQNGLYGLPQLLTLGMTGPAALILGNAVYTLLHAKTL